MKPIATVLLGAVLCTGCAPLPITVASLVADGVSYATTQKSLTDHGLSVISEQDCAMHRILTEGLICHDIDSETTITTVENEPPTPVLTPQPAAVAAVETAQPTATPAAAPAVTATPTGNVAVAHLGSIGDPLPGVYMVLASSRDLHAARRMGINSPAIAPQVFAMPAGGRRVIYHVIVGPVTQSSYPAAQKSAARNGFPNTWALRINELDWRRARELESRAAQKLSAERSVYVK